MHLLWFVVEMNLFFATKLEQYPRGLQFLHYDPYIASHLEAGTKRNIPKRGIKNVRIYKVRLMEEIVHQLIW